jgi:hypothetical protein
MINQKLFHTMSIMVADILLTYGFKLETFTHVARADGRESKEFWFAASSPKCEFDAETVAAYATTNHEALEAKDKEHPILWMRAALMNRNQLVEIIKQAPRMVEIRSGGRKCLIAETASEETKRQIAAML